MSGLMNLQRIEKAFHYDHLVAARLAGAIELGDVLLRQRPSGRAEVVDELALDADDYARTRD